MVASGAFACLISLRLQTLYHALDLPQRLLMEVLQGYDYEALGVMQPVFVTIRAPKMRWLFAPLMARPRRG